MTINDRARKVLSQVVKLHYLTCEPVGSTSICNTKTLSVSPATIRNIMVRLENHGYLHQPHASAGRLPTDQGYRAYVDDLSLLEEPLDDHERVELDSLLAQKPLGPDYLEAVAEYIQDKTGSLAFSIPFRQSGLRWDHVHFQRIDNHRVLVLMVAEGGYTQHAFLDIPGHELTPHLAEKIANYINSRFRRTSVSEIKRRMETAALDGTGRYDLLTDKVAAVANQLSGQLSRMGTLRIRGYSALLAMPEFRDAALLRNVIALLEDQREIKSVIRRTFAAEGPWLTVCIGKEMATPAMEALTLVLARFRNQQDWMGGVGVLGPKRLAYRRTLQILSLANDRVAQRA